MPGRFIDLHTHTLASDGSDTPAELVRKAADARLFAIALTDHDTMDGLGEAQKAAAQYGLVVIPGCEIAVRHGEGELHLLGLWTPQDSPGLKKALAQQRRRRTERNEAMLGALDRLGLCLDMEEVLRFSGKESVGRPHIARALVHRGYVGTIREAFERYIGEGKSAFVPRRILTPEEGIGLLAGAGATVALAHPFLGKGMTIDALDRLLGEFKHYGLTVLEAYHSAHDAGAVRACLALAARHGLLLTGGSDYHGTAKPGVYLGRGKGGMRIPGLLLDKLKEERHKQGLWI